MKRTVLIWLAIAAIGTTSALGQSRHPVKRGPAGPAAPATLKLTKAASGEWSATANFVLTPPWNKEYRLQPQPGTLRVACEWTGAPQLLVSINGAAGHGLSGTISLKGANGASPLSTEVEITAEQAAKGPVLISLTAWGRNGNPRAQGTLTVTLVPAGASEIHEAFDLKRAIQEGKLLSPEEAAAMEAQLRESPENWPARATLLGYYGNTAGLHMSKAAIVQARRPHILWAIENRSSTERMFELPELQFPPSGALADPTGVREAEELWRKAIKQDADNPAIAASAVTFTELTDPEFAEGIVKQQEAMSPDDPYWHRRLGVVFGLAIGGAPDSNFAKHAEEELKVSADADVLEGAAYMLMRPTKMKLVGNPPRPQPEAPPTLGLADELALRAVSADPQDPGRLLAYSRVLDVEMRTAATPGDRTAISKKGYAALQRINGLALTAAGRMLLLPMLAASALQFNNNDEAKTYAREALELAVANREEKVEDVDVSGTASYYGHETLGRVALRAGEVETAKKELLQAADAPVGYPLTLTGPQMWLAQGLLEKGERAVVIEYLDNVGKWWTGGAPNIGAWKTAISQGKTPRLNMVWSGEGEAESGASQTK